MGRLFSYMVAFQCHYYSLFQPQQVQHKFFQVGKFMTYTHDFENNSCNYCFSFEGSTP